MCVMSPGAAAAWLAAASQAAWRNVCAAGPGTVQQGKLAADAAAASFVSGVAPQFCSASTCLVPCRHGVCVVSALRLQ